MIIRSDEPVLRRHGNRRMTPPLASVIILAGAGALACAGAMAQSAPRIPVNALPGGPVGQALIGSTGVRQPQVLAGGFAPYAINGNTATITQTDAAGILRWGSFDIGANAKVIINQPSASAVLLNKVDGGAYLNQTVVDGMLSGNGQVYIYNPNGIIFGKSSQVNVNSLVATTLKIDDGRFLGGILAPNINPIFAADPSVGVPGAIAVEGVKNADGSVTQAQISAAAGGKILLVAPTVVNNGKLSALDGQVALAAGGQVYLASPTDVQMRGLVVAVNNANIGGSSTATNDTLGQVLVGRGNATMVGLAVNQMGLVSATTSVNLNGSIYLSAQDGASKATANSPLQPTHGGALVLGAGSVTEILPTLDDTTTAPATSFIPSRVDLSGDSIHLQENASVIAPAGVVAVRATQNPLSPNPGSASRIYLDAGASIDVSGTTTTQLAMESNVIQVQLRGSELADVPLLRNSPLRGQTVSIDIRKGTPLANVQGWLDLVQHNVGEYTARGGTVSLLSDGDVILSSGSKVNVSGGKVTYRSGYVDTSQVVMNGRLIDIGSANPYGLYSGVVTPGANPRNFEAGYIQGANAGTLLIDAPAMVVRGDLLGGTLPGTHQRDLASLPLGGELLIGSVNANVTDLTDTNAYLYFRGIVDFGGTSTADMAVPGFGEAVPQTLRDTLDLAPTIWSQGGFNRLRAFTAGGGGVTVSSPMQLAPGGELSALTEGAIDLAASISAPGGKISVKSTLSSATGIDVGNGVVLDVVGRWTNDQTNASPALDPLGNPTTPIVLAGGSISLKAATVAIGSDARLDASGGAWMNAGGKLAAGNGGAITVGAGSGSDPNSVDLLLGNNVDFSAYGLASGGKLTLVARDVLLGSGASLPHQLGLDPGWFQQGGFATYDIQAAGNLTVAAGTLLTPRQTNWSRLATTPTVASGSMVDAFGIATLPLAGPLGSRASTSLALSAAGSAASGSGLLSVEPGASIQLDPGGALTLKAGRQLTVDGQLSAPGGKIAVLQTGGNSIWLGSNAILDVSGSAGRLWDNALGITQGTLLSGGQIQIGQYDNKNQLIPAAGFVVVEDGAQLDAAGTTALMTLPAGVRGGVQSRTVASAGGSIDIRSATGLLFAGKLDAAGGNTTAAGGSLTLALDFGNTPLPATPLNLVVGSQAPINGIVPAGLLPDQAVNGVAGQGFVLSDTINRGGFDWVTLKSQNTVSFDGSQTLQARAGLTIDAPGIATSAAASSVVTLNAPYVRLGSVDWRYQTAAAPLPGMATLQVNAGNLDLVGASALQGFGTALLNASGDVRLIGEVPADMSAAPTATTLPVIHATGTFSLAGNLNIASAQIYPTTLSEFTLAATGADSSLTLVGNGNDSAAPLSAACTFTATATNIIQDGVVRAPLGAINFTATDSLTYGAGSLTSVAGSGLVPFGLVQNGRDWLYDFGSGNTVNFSNPQASNFRSLPEKNILSRAASVTVSSGAVLDLSGGGDLLAYEFTPGPGGSRDVLAKAAGSSVANVFAIVPGYTGTVAPQDYQYGQDGGLKPGDSVYLSGVPGLAPGTYTLLPAHYALLPGAFAISVQPGTLDMAVPSSYARLDGSKVTAGYGMSLGGSRAARTTGYLLTPYSLVQQESQFTDYLGNSFLAGAAATLPRDAGRVAFDVTGSLLLDGQVKLDAASGGLRGSADISAPQIAVVADRAQAGIDPAAVKLTVADLMAMGADSLLIGALRDQQPDGQHLTVGAQSVVVASDLAHPLAGAEIILAAAERVQVDSGTVITAQAQPARRSADLLIQGTGSAADGALLRVSGGGAVAVVRDLPAGVIGTLEVQSGATLAASGSMLLDATASVSNKGQLDLASGGSLGLGASRISLGSSAPVSVDGLRFDDAALATFSKLSSLSLTSYHTLDLYGTVNLGSAAMQNLSLTAAGIQAYSGSNGSPGEAAFLADTVRMAGTGSFALITPPPTGAQGSFAVAARNIEIGSNALSIRGYANTVLTATSEARAVGNGGIVTSDGNLTVAAGRLTANSGSDASFVAANILTLTQAAAPVAASTSGQFGGRLNFQGSSIVSDARIETTAGKIVMTATGIGGISITGGELNAAGGTEVFGGTTAYAPAGSVALDGGTGNVAIGTAAVIDVSAIGAAAGSLSVKATNGGNGSVSIDGVLKGAAAAGSDGLAQMQGQFALDVDSVGNAGQFAALNAKLNAGGFIESRSVRVRNGDITVSEALDANGNQVDAIKARQVILSADNGNVIVGGTINASGTKGGRIELYASQPAAAGSSGNVDLLGSGQLLANATTVATSSAGSTGDGGSVIIGTGAADGQMPGVGSGSTINLQSGSVINVSGDGLGANGKVSLRAPRVGGGAGNDVAISALGASVIGSAATTIEGYKVYAGSTISANADGAGNLNATIGGAMYNDAASFMGNSAAILGRLGVASAGVVVNPGVEVRSAGDLTVSVNETDVSAANRGWNLNAWRFGSQPGALTLRAAGSLTIQGSISDGFVQPAANSAGIPDWQLDPSGGASWSYRLVGGSDLGAANPLATVSSSATGDVAIVFARNAGTAADQPVALVRTGTGRIDVAAGRDLMLGSVSDPGTGQLFGATLYTAGAVTAVQSGFVAPSNAANAAFGNNAASLAAFTDGGGAIAIQAGRDVIGPTTDQLINNWMFRQGLSTTDASGSSIFAVKLVGGGRGGAGGTPVRQNTAWWSRFDYFNQGIATFGGGDITVIAGGNITDLAASVATSAYMPGLAPSPGALVEKGGGDLSIRAGGDIRGGVFYVQKGAGNLSADGSVTAGNHRVFNYTSGVMDSLGTILGLGDATMSVTARGDLQIEGAFNPMLGAQSLNNLGVTSISSLGSVAALPNQFAAYSTYGADSAVRLTSISGNVSLLENANDMFSAGGGSIGSATPATRDYLLNLGSDFLSLYRLQAPTLIAAALSGDISFHDGFGLWPSPSGQLELLARGSVLAANPTDAQGNLVGLSQPIVMLDRNPSSMATAANPVAPDQSIMSTVLQGNYAGAGIAAHTPGGLHALDTTPARIIALDGDVNFGGYLGSADILVLPKVTQIQAGRDVVNTGFQIQQMAPTDVSSVTAGRDIIDTTAVGGGNFIEHVVTGPGRIDFTAGRNFDLGNGQGVSTRGNLDNPYLPATGTGISVVAGATPDYSGFASRYGNALADLTSDEQALLTADMKQLQPSLPADLKPAAAWDAFTQASASDRQLVLNDLYFANLAHAAGAIGGGTINLTAFDNVVASLFPVKNISGGDINVFGSQLKTLRGGAVSLFAPGGSVYAGLASLPAYLKSKSASNLGIFTVGGGALQAMVKTDFLVNQGRVFTLGGGDITLVSQYGNIDAGRGAKTSAATPPPLITTDANGNTQVDISASISGSGIATLQSGPGVPTSNVYAIAPRGIFDAGDAGVRSTGTVNLVAATVLNANNIAATGGVTGSPAVSTSSLGGAVAAPVSAATTKTDDIAKAAGRDGQVGNVALLMVELLGYGTEGQQTVTQDGENGRSAKANCKDNSEDCK